MYLIYGQGGKLQSYNISSYLRPFVDLIIIMFHYFMTVTYFSFLTCPSLARVALNKYFRVETILINHLNSIQYTLVSQQCMYEGFINTITNHYGPCQVKQHLK